MPTKKKKKGQSKKPKKASQSQSVQPVEGKAVAVAEAGNGMAGLVKVLIIVSTFVTIAVLSVFSQGSNSTPPGVGVVAIRFSLLSACALIYFLMLYMTRLSRKKSGQKPSDDEK